MVGGTEVEGRVVEEVITKRPKKIREHPKTFWGGFSKSSSNQILQKNVKNPSRYLSLSSLPELALIAVPPSE